MKILFKTGITTSFVSNLYALVNIIVSTVKSRKLGSGLVNGGYENVIPPVLKDSLVRVSWQPNSFCEPKISLTYEENSCSPIMNFSHRVVIGYN